MKVFDGDLIEQRNDSIEFVKKHIQMEAEIKGTERLEKWEYPIEAIREAITNAICHRDYKIASNVQVRIFDDRLEVWGCGPLPDPLTVEDLKKEHRSILRNPLIAKCFFLNQIPTVDVISPEITVDLTEKNSSEAVSI